MDAADLRHHIADYLDYVREFNQRVILIDTGVFRPNGQDGLVTHPEAILRIENQFVSELVHLLNELDRALRHARDWRLHLEDMTRNLYFSPQEQIALFERQQKAIHILTKDALKKRIESQTDGINYLRWVVADTGGELERLLIDMRDLGVTDHGFRDFFQKYQSPELGRWEKALDVWLDMDIPALITALQGFLDEASAGTFEKALIALASYIDVLVNLLAQFSAFSSDFDFLSLKWVSKVQIQFDLLTEASVALHELLVQRTQMGMLYVDHERAILNAVLPTEIDVEEWYSMFASNPKKSAHELLPSDIRTDALPYAMRQSETALVSMDDQVQIGEYLLKSVEVLPELLKSPVVAKLLDADRQRLDLFRLGRQELLRRLRHLRDVVSSKETGSLQ
ncbi:MAG: hypothetical protein ACFFDU_03630 [Candidatus Thorarchaeota archaeon]